MRKINDLKNDKRGLMGIVFFVLVLFTILIIGFIGVMVVTLFVFASDTITPVMESLGVVGAANVSQASEFTFGTVDRTVQALPWLLTFSYVAMLIFSIIFVVAYKFNPHPAYMGVYFLFVVLLIFGAIIMSNMYEEIYTSDDPVIGEGLRDQASMSFLILHSPAIFTVMALIVGIYIFVGSKDEGGFEI